MRIDLNSDVGESYYDKKIGNDLELLPLITSCNIACGFHGGDPLTIQKTISLALEHNVQIGAHPSFPDLENFGRKYMKLSSEELKACLNYQIGAVKSMTENSGGIFKHVKPHGALYNAAAIDFQLAFEIVKVIASFGKGVALVGMANSEMEKAANYFKILFVKEAFADRRYTDEGLLLSRKYKNAVIEDEREAVKQCLSMVKTNKIISNSGVEIALKPQSICVHGDTETAVDLVKALRFSLKENHIKVRSF